MADSLPSGVVESTPSPKRSGLKKWLLLLVITPFLLLALLIVTVRMTGLWPPEPDHRSLLYNISLWVQLKLWNGGPMAPYRDNRPEPASNPSSRDLAAIADIKQNSTALPLCPLVYPLLDENGKVNVMGSYLSLSAMRQASFLPESVFCSINGTLNFVNFGLFNENDPRQKYYYDQLPYYFQNVKDLGEGTLVKVKKGWQVQLRFWGTRPEKKYKKVFKKGKLHLTPGWMAACLQDYMGFQPTKSQAAYRDKPMFVSDEDMDRGAHAERFMNSDNDSDGAALVKGWDALLAKNPDNPYLNIRQLQIADARGEGGHYVKIAELVKQQPDSSLLRRNLIRQMYMSFNDERSYAPAIEELRRDNNNKDLYFWATDSLWYHNYKSAAIDLAKIWTELHPENPDAWFRLMRLYKEMAGSEMGGTWARFMDKDTRKAVVEWDQQAIQALDQAAKLVPQDAVVWGTYLEFGSVMAFDQTTMDGYFNKMRELNPYYEPGTRNYSDYLWPQNYGSTKELEAFDRKYDPYLPALYSAYAESIWRVLDYYDCTVEGRKAFLKELQAKIGRIKVMPDFEASIENYLTLYPFDLQMWHNYFLWEISGQRQGHPFEFAKKISEADPDLPALGPTLVLVFDDEYKKNLLYDPDENWIYDHRSDIVKRDEQAYVDLASIEPNDWRALNQLAFYAYKHRDMRLTEKTLATIGDHWAGEVWPREIFDKAKKMTAYNCLDCGGTGADSCGAPGCVHGYVRCPNHCLQIEEGEWVHLHEDGHSDTDIWKKYYYFGGVKFTAFSQAHVGRLVEFVDGKWKVGEICPLCHGTGWIKCPACQAKIKCDTCAGTGKQAKLTKL